MLQSYTNASLTQILEKQNYKHLIFFICRFPCSVLLQKVASILKAWFLVETNIEDGGGEKEGRVPFITLNVSGKTILSTIVAYYLSPRSINE